MDIVDNSSPVLAMRQPVCMACCWDIDELGCIICFAIASVDTEVSVTHPLLLAAASAFAMQTDAERDITVGRLLARGFMAECLDGCVCINPNIALTFERSDLDARLLAEWTAAKEEALVPTPPGNEAVLK
ncbi:hypothetical protein ACFU8W_31310 [Streptomyces sp. NPDC057565]|uniref:hypothetical protein n=1 Tax=Streptomyces sp. NPDC057565 TaxID=3346169 RepID=UPI00367D5FF9